MSRFITLFLALFFITPLGNAQTRGADYNLKLYTGHTLYSNTIESTDAGPLAVGPSTATTVDIGKSGAETDILGTLNVDEAATFDSTLGVTDAVTLGTTSADVSHVIQSAKSSSGNVLQILGNGTAGTYLGITEYAVQSYFIGMDDGSTVLKIRPTSTATASILELTQAGGLTVATSSGTTDSHKIYGSTTSSTYGLEFYAKNTNPYGIAIRSSQSSATVSAYPLLEVSNSTGSISLFRSSSDGTVSNYGYLQLGQGVVGTGGSAAAFAVKKITGTWTASTSVTSTTHGLSSGRIKHILININGNMSSYAENPGGTRRLIKVTKNTTNIILSSYDSAGAIANYYTSDQNYEVYIFYEAS